MRILHYTSIYAPAWSYGGPPRSISILCESLAACGHEVTVLTTNAGLGNHPEIPIGRPVRRRGVTVHYFPSSRGWTGLSSPALEAAVEKCAADFDLLHVTGVWQQTSRAACRAARRAGRPYVCSPRGALGTYSFSQKSWKKWPYFLLWERANLNGSAALHFTSPMELEECRRLGLGPRSFIVPNCVDLSSWRRDDAAGRAWRTKHGISDDEFVMLYAGRLHDKKGLDLFGEIGAILPSDPTWRLVLVGDDEDGTGERLRRKMAEAGRGGRLQIMSVVETEELTAAYSGANIFAFPSRNESFGNVVIEALACGCPVAVSDQVGVAAQVAGIPGVTVLPRNPGRWAGLLLTLIADHSRAAEVSRVEVERLFSPEVVGRAMAENYASAMGK